VIKYEGSSFGDEPMAVTESSDAERSPAAVNPPRAMLLCFCMAETQVATSSGVSTTKVTLSLQGQITWLKILLHKSVPEVAIQLSFILKFAFPICLWYQPFASILRRSEKKQKLSDMMTQIRILWCTCRQQVLHSRNFANVEIFWNFLICQKMSGFYIFLYFESF